MITTQQSREPRASALSATSHPLKRWITRHPVGAYLILAYGVSWAIFLVPLLSNQGIGLLHFDTPPIELFILLVSLVGLAGSAFTITAIVDGRAGIRRLAARYVRWRVGIQWYVIALFGLLATTLVGLWAVYGLAPLVTLVRQPSLIIGYLVQTVVVAALVNLWEETGWTGFMFTRLQPRYGALMASLLVAPCFGGIHLPLLFVTDGLTSGRLAPPQIPLYTLYLLVVFSVPVRVVASWLYNNARGSLLHVGLLHASLGAVAGSVLLPYLVPHGADPTFVVYGAIAVLALVVGLVTRGRLSYKASLELQPAPSAM